LFQKVQFLEFKTGRDQSTHYTCSLLTPCDLVLIFWLSESTEFECCP